jgi:hypothetical protein
MLKLQLEELQKIIESLGVKASVCDHGLDAARLIKFHEWRL